MVLLCIDDDQEDIELFQEAVRTINDNYSCLIATNGWEGLKEIEKNVPDYIFLDMNMPVMDGKETLIHIRANRKLDSVPVFILSTSNDLKEAESCRKLGATKWLVKPGSFGELVQNIRNVINASIL